MGRADRWSASARRALLEGSRPTVGSTRWGTRVLLRRRGPEMGRADRWSASVRRALLEGSRPTVGSTRWVPACCCVVAVPKWVEPTVGRLARGARCLRAADQRSALRGGVTACCCVVAIPKWVEPTVGRLARNARCLRAADQRSALHGGVPAGCCVVAIPEWVDPTRDQPALPPNALNNVTSLINCRCLTEASDSSASRRVCCASSQVRRSVAPTR